MRCCHRLIFLSALFVASAAIVGLPGHARAGALLRQRQLIEVGAYVGAFFPSSKHELFSGSSSQQSFDDVVAHLGARASYLHYSFLGAEIELGVLPTSTSGGQSAVLYALRAHAVGQLPLWGRFSPFVVLGGGILGVVSDRDAVGSNVDPAFQWGVGAKYYWKDWLVLRADFRHSLTDGVGFNAANHLELLAGASWVFGWKAERERPRVVRRPQPRDSDGDGIADARDQCPKRRGLGLDGCPPEEEEDEEVQQILASMRERREAEAAAKKAEAENQQAAEAGAGQAASARELPAAAREAKGILVGVTFSPGQARLEIRSSAKLSATIALLRRHPALELLVRGHTDSVGSRDKNMALALRRAHSVRSYLVAKGIDASRVTIEGVGPDDPIATNATAAGRAQNRRIELVPRIE